MIVAAIWDVLVFAAFAFGFGTACAPRRPASPVLRLISGAVVAFGAAFVIGFTGFAVGLSNAATAATLGLVALAVCLARWRPALALLREPAVRHVLIGWAVFAGWSLGLLALVETYSGGGWVADWFEHWQRTVFFLDRQPLETRFAVIYSLTARPPLANVVIALFLAATRATFAHYQVFMTLLGTLTLLPAWELTERWRKAAVNGPRGMTDDASRGVRAPRPQGGWWVLLLFMVNPLMAENLTFAWTKLPTAFFVLAAVCLVIESFGHSGVATSVSEWSDDSGRAPSLHIIAALALALGMATHYSAGPWIVAIVIGFAAVHRAELLSAGFWRRMAMPALVFVAVLGLWVGWAALHFGVRGTTETNTTAEAWASQTVPQRLATTALNIVDTLVPFPLRGEPADGLIDQTSRLGRIRDVAFNVYQVNLPLALGLGGLWVLACAVALRRRERGPASNERSPAREFLWVMLPLAAVVGIVVHTPRDQWGLAHICLQPLVLVGLAAAAAAIPGLPRRARIGWAALATLDVALGIVLQFGLESWAFAPFVAPADDRIGFLRALSRSAAANANDKWAFHVDFFADRLHAPVLLVTLWLVLLLALVIDRTGKNVSAPR